MGRIGTLGAGGIVAAFSLAVISWAGSGAASRAVQAAGEKPPVLVELFTSESCSSCPPADRLLAKIQESEPSVIVLSEHVTYWNGLGWRDPYSSSEATERQRNYAENMGLSGSYTPQMVVNGQFEFVGSDARSAAKAIEKSSARVAVPVRITGLGNNGGHVSFTIETGAVAKNAQLLVVFAQDEGIEHVAHGENGGSTLRHVQIARVIRQVADLKNGSAYKGAFSAELPQAIAGSGWHVVAFLQQGPGGFILGAASQAI
jgi:hypothetical protein